MFDSFSEGFFGFGFVDLLFAEGFFGFGFVDLLFAEGVFGEGSGFADLLFAEGFFGFGFVDLLFAEGFFGEGSGFAESWLFCEVVEGLAESDDAAVCETARDIGEREIASSKWRRA